MSHRERLIAALDASMDALQVADDLNDEDAAWLQIVSVLRCLQNLEEQAKTAGNPAYYDRRGNSTDGRIAGALIWIHGLVVHHEAQFRQHLFRPFAIAGDDNSLQPLTVRTLHGGQLVLVDDVVWPQRRLLPTPGRRYKSHQRDGYYDSLVAGQPVMEPLRSARRFFLDDQHPGN